MVNIAGSERKNLMRVFEDLGAGGVAQEKPDIFDRAMTELEKVMELDLYVKFIALAKDTQAERVYNRR